LAVSDAPAAGADAGEVKTQVFISYSRKDMAFADRLESALKARGFEVLIDRQEIYAFEDWWKRIEALIGRSDTVVFVLSPDAVKSSVALKEITYAASLNKRFAPIVWRQVEEGTVPETLRRLNFIFFDDLAKFDASADRLAEGMQIDIGWIRQHTEYGEGERRWAAAGHPRGLLLHSPALEVAEHWITSRPRSAPEPATEIGAFIVASRKAMLGTQRLRRIALGSIISLMMAVIVGLVGWINQSFIAGEWRQFRVTWPYELANVRPYVLSAAKERALKRGDSFRECAQDCPDMIVVPAGSFTMGSPSSERGRNANEGPQHSVTIGKPFAVSKYDVTFADWDACAIGGGCSGYVPNDEGWGRGDRPVINVSWDDSQQYVAWLSAVTGKPYRLLTDAQYEYVARAGSTTAYPWGGDIQVNGRVMANCKACGSKWDGRLTAPVGSFPPNRFGLYDMAGNVYAWIEDCVHKNYVGAPANGSAWLQANGGNCSDRLIRGGAWVNPPDNLRTAFHTGYPIQFRDVAIGLRVGRSLDTR
jgi:formylglycine-generating enzyme required for sulfatase activity